MEKRYHIGIGRERKMGGEREREREKERKRQREDVDRIEQEGGASERENENVYRWTAESSTFSDFWSLFFVVADKSLTETRFSPETGVASYCLILYTFPCTTTLVLRGMSHRLTLYAIGAVSPATTTFFNTSTISAWNGATFSPRTFFVP